MKKIFFSLSLLFILFGNAFCQLKVDNLGHVGLGTNYPNSGYQLHVKGDVLLSTYPDYNWYEFRMKFGENNVFNLGSTNGYLDFYTSTGGYNIVGARQYNTHHLWGKSNNEITNGLEIVMGLNPCFHPADKANNAILGKGEYVLGPDELLNLVPGAITINDDSYGVDYNQIVPLLVAAVQEQQSIIETLTQKLEILEGFNSVPSNEEEGENDGNILYQNKPNPFNTVTVIECYLNEERHDTSIVINDMNGSLIKKIPVLNQGINNITVESGVLKPGVYSYSLTIGGRTVCSKKMVITSK